LPVSAPLPFQQTTMSSDAPFSHGFLDKDSGTARARKLYLTTLAKAVLMVIIAAMSVLSIYWGAFWKTFQLVHGLHGIVVDFDGGQIGGVVTGALSQVHDPGQLTYDILPASLFPGGAQDVVNYVLDERTWFAIVVNTGATSALSSAAASAGASYNGSSAITVYTEEARNENSYSFVMLPIIQATLQQITANFTLTFARTLAGPSASQLLANAPSIVTRPVDFAVINLRPFDVSVATAIDFVGLIYLLIIAFISALLNTNIRQLASGVERRLTLRSLLAVRLIVPLVVYFIVSLFYSLVSVAFQVSFNRVFGHAGFVIYWMLSFLGMAALGLAVEAAVTLLTPRFIAFFLILWIICNVSVSFFPIEILPTVFRYGYATPFYNVSKAVRTLLFNTKNELGLNFGVLFAWIAVSLVTIPVFQTLVRRREVHEWHKSQGHSKGFANGERKDPARAETDEEEHVVED